MASSTVSTGTRLGCARRGVGSHAARLPPPRAGAYAPRPPIRPTLEGSDAEVWDEASSVLMDVLELEPEAADKMLENSFGWRSQHYWRQEKKDEMPVASEIQARFEFLATQGIEGDDLKKVCTTFPEVIACDVEERLAANFAYLEKEYFMKGKNATKAVLRKPDALGNVIDCTKLDGCVGECNRCWVRF